MRILVQEEKTQILTTNVRIEQKWKDENLGWNQSEHVGIRGIRLPSHRIWLPDSYIYNSAFDLSSDSPMQGVVNGKTDELVQIEFRFRCAFRTLCDGLSYRRSCVSCFDETTNDV